MESRWKRRFLFSNVVIYAISALAIVGSGYFKFGNSTDVLIFWGGVFDGSIYKYEKYYSKDEIIEASDVDFEAEDNFILSTVSIGYLEIHYIREHLDDFATVA